MAKCKKCGKDVPQNEMLIHYQAEHPTLLKPRRSDPPQPKGSPEEKPKAAGTMDPMQAAIMESVGEKLQLAMTLPSSMATSAPRRWDSTAIQRHQFL